jgi:type I restriction enzyme S subunit
MSFARYPSYKDSGVEWLGQVPADWAVKRLKHNLNLLTEKTDRRENPVALENIEGWTGRFIVTETEFLGEGVAFEAGDILFGKLRPYLAKAYRAEFSGEAVGDFHVMRPVKGVDSRFAQYQILNREFIAIVDGSTFGSKMPRASWEFVGGMLVTTPPVAEQTQIAAFLDRETAKIDGLVAEQRRLMALLKEKRQAVISRAVTRGLNPDAPMKPSGIEWLGDVPVHWEVRRVKSVSTFTTSGPRGWSERVGDEGSLFVQSGDLNERLEVEFSGSKRVQVAIDAEASRTRLCDGDVVVCITGAKTGNVAICVTVPESAYINQHLCLIRPAQEILPVFLGVLLKCNLGQTYFDFSQYGLKQGLSLEDVREAPVLLPSLAEQSAIVDYVGAETAKFDTLTAEAQRAIDLLQERRTALISAAVTGQIDVRESP